jgi:surface antigen
MSGVFEAAPVIADVPQLYPPQEVNPSRLRELVDSAKRLIGRSALALGLASGLVVGEATIVEPVPAVADTGGYPDAEAPCVTNNNNQITGTGYWCADYSWGYYTRDNHGNITGSTQLSSRGFGYRNCTDWAAFRAKQLIGILVPYGAAMGDGKNWDDNAPAAGYTVDNTPEPGDIAVWDAGTHGHVAVVESVNSDNSVNVSEYNKNQDGTYGTRSHVTADHYVDLNGTGKGVNGDVIAGGASESTTLARPAAIAHSGALNVFTRGGDGQIYNQYWNGTSWTGFSGLGGNMASDPAVIVNGGALNVFARGADGQIYTKYNSGSGWTGWASMGATTMKGNPRVAQYGSELDVVALGADNHPYKNTWQPTTGWGGWSSLGNYMDSSPTVLQYGTELDVVMRGGDNTVYKDMWNGSSWGGFDSLGCCLVGNPDALQYGSQLDIWANSQTGHIWKRTWNGSSWGNWTDMGGNYAGDPDAMQYNGDLNVFVRGTNGQVYTRYWSANGQFWSSWASIGGNIAGEPTAVQYGTELTVFATGVDGKTYKNTFQPATGWGTFTALPG